ncbi:PREDICTED: glycine-rich [Prunus dulcis]|uniref:PREDICTED: glycine-rich n=1 Tax=Prunus dulcis TaxID=3755 RepID=A0A5E4F6W3_PRUDU|nr:PREDICTED: glycine-rich [Prunus dulcis]
MRGSNGGFGILRTSALGRSFWARHSSTNLFVGGLSYDTNEPVLKEAFGKHGEIIEVKVICDHVSGKSKGQHCSKRNGWSVARWQTNPLGICTQGVMTLISGTVDWRGHVVVGDINHGQGQTKQKWQTPHANTLKINVDGAWKPGTTEGGVGVVVIDSTGKFVAGCAVKCILCTTSGGFGCKNKYSIGNGKVTP